MSLNYLNNFVIEQASIFQQTQIQLKNNSNKVDFRQNSNLISIKSRLAKPNSPELIKKNLNEVGIMSMVDLGKIFSRKKAEISVSITAQQKELLKTLMSKKDSLNDELKQKISYFTELFKTANHNNMRERYSFADVMFNNDLASTFRQQCEKEGCSGNFLFIHDLKNALENPNLETLREIFIDYCQYSSPFKISITPKTRGNLEKVFRSTAPICELIEALRPCVDEVIHTLKGIYQSYKKDYMKDAVRFDCLQIKSVSGRMTYLNNLIGSGHIASEASKNMIREDREKMFTNLNQRF